MKNLTKFFGIIALVAVIGFSVVACGGINDNGGDSVNDFEYSEDNDHIEIWKYKGNGGNVTIPSKIKGKPVTKINDNLYGSYGN